MPRPFLAIIAAAAASLALTAIAPADLTPAPTRKGAPNFTFKRATGAPAPRLASLNTRAG